MPISWAAALRLYGKTHGGFQVPKKGSAVYDAVKKLQASTEMSAEHEVKKRVSKKAKAEKMAVVAEAHEPTTKARRAPTAKGGAAPEVTRNADPIVPPAASTKPIEAAGGAGSRAQNIKDTKPEVENAGEKPVKKRRGVKSSGLTAGVATQEFLVNDNVMGGGAASAQMPGQKKRLKETLAKKDEEVKVVTVGNGEERTIEGMKTDDPEAVSGRAPFSFQSLRNRLLC
jgi:hypothetical protein